MPTIVLMADAADAKVYFSVKHVVVPDEHFYITIHGMASVAEAPLGAYLGPKPPPALSRPRMGHGSYDFQFARHVAAASVWPTTISAVEWITREGYRIHFQAVTLSAAELEERTRRDDAVLALRKQALAVHELSAFE